MHLPRAHFLIQKAKVAETELGKRHGPQMLPVAHMSIFEQEQMRQGIHLTLVLTKKNPACNVLLP